MSASWLEGVQGQLVALDTAPLIYYIEEHPRYLPLLDPFFDALDSGALHAVTSTMTLLEVLVRPLRQNDLLLARRYRDILLDLQWLYTVALSASIAEGAAHLRAAHRLTPPDAVQLATALNEGATAFLTNDARLPRLPNLRTLLLDEL